ncbi:Alcohol dehydrogenase superfamily, zinc-containing [Magnetospirillum sp. LM-5]|uniref:bi-domain-containing oxidoreductase n=1 Tax=Magnetospirillum sp. LM-5 TaxID=2681466 RepID=UPI00138181A4|nr:bi-domain-containing oxidoreductase [Magnetospirillum sp. LM-5]CAA7622637.1 Alcohol dehydrogenase superfamily, zinc-containing [Magnetospirillum sp. LM-5]
MKQVIQSARSGKLALTEVPEPRVRSGAVLVRTRASLISAGTERMVIDFAKKSLAGKAKERPDLVRKVVDKAKRDGVLATFKAVMARLDEPLPLGYSAAGEVVAVGAGCEGLFQVGQRVAMAGAGLANHAELNVVPRNLVAPIPDGISDEEACFGTVAAIAMAGLRNLAPQLGDVVAVLGVGLVGQIAQQLATLAGVRVIAIDVNAARLELARRTGAELAWKLGEPGLAEAVAALTGGLGCDGILVCAATESSEPLELAAELARDRAKVVMVGKTGTEFPYAAFMKKELQLMVSRSYGPGRYDEDFEGRGLKYPAGWVRWTEAENLKECVRLMSPALTRRLDVGALITHRFPFERAEDAYQLVTGGAEPHLGVILHYEEQTKAAAPSFPAPRAAAGGCTLGVVGAGNFARTVLLPEFKRLPGVSFHTICTTRGQTAEHARTAFGFAKATTDLNALLADPAINGVLVATRHSNHAELTARCLAAGKSVIVEKPLALDRAQLNQVITARQDSAGFFLVGFNRRFAPLTVKARALLARHHGPKMLVLRVNAGALPAESWVNAAEEGGGRILGEVCHFIDLARALVGSPIATVQADAARVTHGGCDDLTVTLAFKDGSLATIIYTAQGDSSYSKERFECFAGGTVLVIDNFLTLTVTENGKTRTEKAGLGQDKGHRAELEAFAAAVAAGGPAPVDEAELIETSLATIAVLESLARGQRVSLAE